MNSITAIASRLVVGFIVVSAFRASGQGQAPPTTATNPTASTGYVCVQRNADSRIWQSAMFQTNSEGDVTTNYMSYTEIGTGMCYLSGSNYIDTVEQVDSVPGGAEAVQGPTKVQWALNAATPGGAVTITTSDAKSLSCTVFGLAYYDQASGSNAAIGTLQNSEGSIVAPNGVLFTNSFSNVNADILYTYTKAGLSQDIVLHQAPPAGRLRTLRCHLCHSDLYRMVQHS